MFIINADGTMAIYQTLITENVSGNVPRIGLEPTHLTVPDPKSGASANSATRACTIYIKKPYLWQVKPK